MRRAPSLLGVTMVLLALSLVVALIVDLLVVLVGPIAPTFRWLLP